MHDRSIIHGCLLFFLASVIFTVRGISDAYAAAFTMGQLQTVASDGSLDVIRNPSLMTIQTKDNSMGFLFLSTPYVNRRYSYGAVMGSTVSHPQLYESKFITGSVYLTYCRKIGHSAVGVAVDSGNPYQVMYSRYNSKFYGLNTVNPAAEYMRVGSDLLTISPRFVISYGVTVSGNHSIGLQGTVGYSHAKERSDVTSMYNTSISAMYRSTKITQDLNGELSLGYLYRTANSQAGLMVRSGRFNWEKTKIRYYYGNYEKLLMFQGRVGEPYYLQYDRGFSILAGGYHKLAKFFAVALEGEYEIPIHYNYKAVRYDLTTAFMGMTANMTVRTSGLYSVKAGFEIIPEGPVTINLGGKISTFHEKRRSRRIQESNTTDTYAGIAGIDLKLTDAVLIMIGSQLVYTHKRERKYSTYEEIGSVSYDGLTRSLTVDLFCGFSFGF